MKRLSQLVVVCATFLSPSVHLFAKTAGPADPFEPQGCINGDCSNGYGTYVFPNGNRYVGDFKGGKPHGKGILYCSNGNKYLGDWQENWQQGEGKFIYREGHEYTGQFQRNHFHGKGIMQYANGDTYEGDWRSSLPEGIGKYSFNTGDRYEGQFVAGSFHGQGSMFYKDGGSFTGQWANSKKHGKGTFVDKSGQQVQGHWQEGELLENGQTLPEENGSRNPQTTGQATSGSTGALSTIRVWAVVVGIATYTHMPSLRYTDDDAYQFYAFLKSPEGGALPDEQLRVLIDDNATQSNVLTALRSVAAKADDNDVLLFYYSGHGVEGAFIPVDFDGYSYQLQHSEIRKIMEQSRAKQKLVLGDACHSGSLIGANLTNDMWAAKAPMKDMLDRYYKAFENCAGGMALLMSSKSKEVSLEDSGLRSGVFSHYLVRGLKGEADRNADQIVSIQELFDYVQAKVSSYTAGAQNPILTGKYDQRMPVGVVRG